METNTNEAAVVPAPKSVWTRLWRWLCDSDRLEEEARDTERWFTERTESIYNEKMEKRQDAMREKVYAQYIATHATDDNLHKTALVVAQKAAIEYMRLTYGWPKKS
jgi:hypothetical protein